MHHPKRIHGSREIFEKSFRAKPSIISGWSSIRIQIPPAAVLLLELERLYESCEIIMRGGEALSRAEPPAGPPKFTKVSIFDHFFEKFVPFATFPRDRFYACNPQISTIYKLTASD